MLRSAELASRTMEFQNQKNEPNAEVSSTERHPSREFFKVHELLGQGLMTSYAWSTNSDPQRSTSPISIDLDRTRALSAPPRSTPSLDKIFRREIIKVGESINIAR
ncbi:MAG: hypothetical protein ACO201_06720 [Rickettsiales bacterium]